MVPTNVLPFRPRRRREPDWLDISRRFWTASLDRLALYLETMKKETMMPDLKITAPTGESTMTLTRTFNAPRALVWKALSEPEHIVRWFGPHGYTNKVLQFDFKVPGKWRIETSTPEGSIIFHGEYREIVPIERVTQTFAFEGLPEGMFSVERLTLEDHGDKTVYRVVSTFPDVQSRDAMMASGMEKGVVEGFERLDRMLEEFKQIA